MLPAPTTTPALVGSVFCGHHPLSEFDPEGWSLSLQGNQKTKEGSVHPDRDAQFRFIHGRAEDFQRRGQPVVSVDTQKKELVGDFKNGGREWRPQGNPEPVRVDDLVDQALGKANPYGVYDPAANGGWVSVGTDHDPAEFAGMFSHISMNGRGKPLFSHEVVVNLIAGTTTRTGLKIEAELDTNAYPKGIHVTDEELEKIKIERADFHGEWNYTILPST